MHLNYFKLIDLTVVTMEIIKILHIIFPYDLNCIIYLLLQNHSKCCVYPDKNILYV